MGLVSAATVVRHTLLLQQLFIPCIQITVMYKNPVTRHVPISLRSVALALCKGNWLTIAQAVMKCSMLSSLIVDIVLKQLRDECEHLCSQSHNSMLRDSSPDALMSFNWQCLANELKKKAPLLFAVMLAAGGPPHPRNIQKGACEQSRYPAVCTATAILLKERCDFMSALQHLIGIFLFQGNASKQVNSVLQ